MLSHSAPRGAAGATALYATIGGGYVLNQGRITAAIGGTGSTGAGIGGGSDTTSDVPIVAGVNPISVGAAPYHDGALKVLGFPAYEGGQLLWAGLASMPACSESSA